MINGIGILIGGANQLSLYFKKIILAFQARVVADSGIFESFDCMKSSLKTITKPLYEQASLVVTPNGYKASKLYVIKPTDASGDLSVTRATTATRINSSGLIESVSTNVPRLDYTNSTCPSILVEPQRTNVFTNSEGNLATYGTALGNVSNASTSISGFSNSIQFGNNSVATSAYKRTFTPTIGVQYTMSIFVQMNDDSLPVLGLNTTTGDFSLIINNTLATLNPVVQKIGVSNVYKVSATFTATGTSTIFGVSKATTQSSKPFRFTGIQLEAGSNATSYIPTVAATVTRNADVISKTGISSLIGQTEGTILCDINLTKLSEGKCLFVIDNGTTNEYIALTRISSNIFRLSIKKTGTSAVNIINSAVINDSRCKIAIAYKNGDYAMYINGVEKGTSTNSTDFPTTSLTQVVLSNSSYGQLNDSYNISAIWKTRLTNEQLSQLTTI